jgi:hypothetical protein
MSTLFTSEPRRSMPFITGGTIERMFADGPNSLCPARLAFHKADQRPPADDGWAMLRGILAGAVVESELFSWALREGLSVDLGAVLDTQMVRQHIDRRLTPERLAVLRAEVLVMVRQWQEQFPDTNDGLAWEDATRGLEPQTDLVVVRQRNEPVFGLRVRPDIVVRLGNCLVAVEISTAKSLDAVASARVALNHFALLATVERTPELRGQIHRVGTRVELLAQRTGYTRFLGADEAAEWHSAIINAATSYLTSDTAPRRGPWCNRCPHFAPCQMMELDAMSEMEF